MVFSLQARQELFLLLPPFSVFHNITKKRNPFDADCRSAVIETVCLLSHFAICTNGSI